MVTKIEITLTQEEITKILNEKLGVGHDLSLSPEIDEETGSVSLTIGTSVDLNSANKINRKLKRLREETD